MRTLTAEPAIERLPRVDRGRARRSERAAEDRVGAEPALGRRSVELDQRLVERALIRSVEAADRVCDLAVHVPHCLQHTLAEVHRRVAVAQLHRLVLTRRGTRWDDRAAKRA